MTTTTTIRTTTIIITKTIIIPSRIETAMHLAPHHYLRPTLNMTSLVSNFDLVGCQIP